MIVQNNYCVSNYIRRRRKRQMIENQNLIKISSLIELVCSPANPFVHARLVSDVKGSMCLSLALLHYIGYVVSCERNVGSSNGYELTITEHYCS